MSVSNTVTKVEEFDFEDEALEVLETDAELTSDEELVAVEGASEDVREEFDASAKSLDATPDVSQRNWFFTAPYCRRRSALCSSCLTW
ncbi:hypothetical protein VCCP104114_0551 [Vibrio cholerae CP1041(14)]|nr:hypothetical protein VCCP104114_0551 [Vibrio cholerae CP1041(14)]